MYEVILLRGAREYLDALELRLLYFFDGRKILVTHGFLKKTDKLPARELNRADRIHEAYYTRPR